MKTIDKKVYMTISQFSKASGISRKNLIYYDTIGLFSPDIVLENGYRYYYYRQLYTIQMIHSLRDIGMSIKEIKEYTTHRTPNQMISLFEKQSNVISAEIEKLTQIKNMMDMHVEMAKTAEHITLGQIVLEQHEEEAIFLGEILTKEELKNLSQSRMMSKFFQYARANGFHCTFPWGIRMDLNYYLTREYKENPLFYYRVFKKTSTSKPAGSYMVCYAQGNEDGRRMAYQLLMEYAKKNHLKVQGYIYEDYLLNEISIQNPDDYLARICVPVHVKAEI